MRQEADAETLLWIAIGVLLFAMSTFAASMGSYIGIGFALFSFSFVAALCVTDSLIVKRTIRRIMIVGILVVTFFAARGIYRLSTVVDRQQALLIENIDRAVAFLKYASQSGMGDSDLPIRPWPEGMPLPPEFKFVNSSFRRTSVEGQELLVLEYGGTEWHFGYQALFVNKLEPGKQMMILYAMIESRVPILLYVEKDSQKIFKIGDERGY